MPRFLVTNTSQQHSGFADVKGLIDRQILSPRESRLVIGEIIEAHSPYVKVEAAYEQRCSDCGAKYYGPHPARFELALCVNCTKHVAEEGGPVDDTYTFRQGTRSTVLFK